MFFNTRRSFVITFDTEARHRSIETPTRVVQVSAVEPGGAGIEIVELHDGRALCALLHLYHPLSADGVEVLVSAEFNRKLTCDSVVEVLCEYTHTGILRRVGQHGGNTATAMHEKK